MAYDDSWSDFMTLTPSDYGLGSSSSIDLMGFKDPTYSWDNLGGGFDTANLFGGDDARYLNFGLSDPFDAYSGSMPTFGGVPNSSPFSGLDTDPNMLGYLSAGASNIGSMLGDAGKWLTSSNASGTGSNLGDLGKLALGGLGLYGSYRSNAADRKLAERRLGMEKAVNDRALRMQERAADLGMVDDLASKAMGMQLLINRGRMTADQTNPWLNQMYAARSGLLSDNPVLNQIYASNPFAGMALGAANTMPTSADQFFSALDPMRKANGGLASYDEYAGGARYFGGGSGGQDDKINAFLSDGEYVFDADTVAALGDGNNRAGAAKLDEMRKKIREHKRSAPSSDIPPKAKSPFSYLGD